MGKRNAALEAEMTGIQPQESGKPSRGSLGRFLRRSLLLLLTLAVMAVGTASLFFYTVLNGPSPIARSRLNLALLEDSRTSWIPGLFIEEDPTELPVEQEG